MAAPVKNSPWTLEGDEKKFAVQSMFSDIAPSYDLMNSLMSLRMHRAWRRIAVQTLALRPDSCVLDLCCGTGDLLVEMKKVLSVAGFAVGLDFAQPMLQKAKEKTQGPLILGDACQLPFQSGQFDAVTVGWGLRNLSAYETGLKEAVRVLKPGGRFVSLDMARPKGLIGTFSEKVFHAGVPLLGRLFGKKEAYTYLPQSTLAYVSPDRLAEIMTAVGFRDTRFKTLFFGNVCMHWAVKA